LEATTTHRPENFQTDPIDIVDRALAPEDQEIVAFVIAGLSYGRVEQIHRSVKALLGRLHTLAGLGPSGEGLARFLRELSARDEKALARALKGWVHRMNTASDLVALFRTLSRVLDEHDSLCRMFQLSHHSEPREQIVLFVERLLKCAPRTRSSRASSASWRGTGVEWFAASPASGGSCKRLMMWLRWMVRSDHIDLGTWTREELLDPTLPRPHSSRLFIPVDTHVFQWARRQGVITQKSTNWKAVEAITNHLRTLEPKDPVKFDFEICHQGMTAFRARRSKSSF
jgi:uncharacterized protein (TIGR02757 family)